MKDVLIPFTDGTKQIGVSVNLDDVIENEGKNIIEKISSIISKLISFFILFLIFLFTIGFASLTLAKYINSINRTSNPEKTQPIKSEKTFGRNSRVSVRYSDGSVKKDIKFKKVEVYLIIELLNLSKI